MVSGLVLVLAVLGAAAGASASSAPCAIAGNDCPECSSTALCAAHQKAQSDAAKEQKPKLHSKDLSERMSALKQLAILNAEHPGIPSSEIAELVAGALDDESTEVKTAAAKCLGEGLHPDVAVRALISALDQLRKDMAKSGGGRYGGAPENDQDPKAAERRRQREQTTQYAQALVGSIARLPDDRCVDALSELLLGLTRRNGADLLPATAEALIKFETRPAFEAIFKKIKASPPGKGGGRWGPDTTGRTLHDMVLAWATSKGLEDMPSWDDKDLPDWEHWFAKNQAKVAVKLGKYNLERMRKDLAGAGH